MDTEPIFEGGTFEVAAVEGAAVEEVVVEGVVVEGAVVEGAVVEGASAGVVRRCSMVLFPNLEALPVPRFIRFLSLSILPPKIPSKYTKTFGLLQRSAGHDCK